MNIKNKISIIFLFMFSTIVIVMAITLSLLSIFFVKEEVIEQLETIATLRSNHLNTYFEQNIERLKLITSRTKLRSTLLNYNEKPNQEDLATIEGIIKDATEPIDNFERICVLDTKGKVIVSTNKKFINRNCENEDFFQLSKDEYNIFFEEEDDGLKIYVSGPFRYEGEFLGVALTVVNTKVFEEIINQETGLGKTGEVLLAKVNDNQPYFLNKKRFNEDNVEFHIKTEDIQPMRHALNGENKFFNTHLDYRGVEVLAVTRYLKKFNLGLVVKIDKKDAFSEVTRLSYFFIGISLFFVILYYFLLRLFIDKITKPIEDLKRGVEIVEKGNLDYKTNIHTNDEIEDLSIAFNKMSKAVKFSRKEVDKKVKEQTDEIEERNQEMADRQKAILNILEDVDEEKEKNRKLAQDLEKFKLAVENASDHIVITDADGIILYANSGVKRITGYDRREIIGQKAGTKDNWGGQMPLKTYKKFWKTIKEERKDFMGEFKNIRKNGEEYTAMASVSPILDAGGNVIFFLAIERDITKEKEIDKAKTEFVSLASHQLRTPLSAINWYVEMLLAGDAGEISKDQKDYLQEIYDGNQRMIELVGALLNVSRIELGTFAVDPHLVDIKKIAESVLKELAVMVKDKKIKLTKKYDKKLKKIKLDDKLIRIVFQNLLTNAVKYNDKNGKVSLEIKKRENDILIKVADTGYGIPKKDYDKLFTKMFRADNVKERDTTGTGLGLYIVKSIVEQSEGKIWFESVEGKGTTFYFTLPLKGMKKKKGTRALES